MFVEALLPIGSAFDNLGRQHKIIEQLERNNEIAEQKTKEEQIKNEQRKKELELKQQRQEDLHIASQDRHILAQQRIEKQNMYLQTKRVGFEASLQTAQNAVNEGGIHTQINPQ